MRRNFGPVGPGSEAGIDVQVGRNSLQSIKLNLKKGRMLGLLVGLVNIQAAAAASPFAFSVVYGDSFTDYFNMYAYRGQPGPPFYAPGRRCNGPVWIEYLTNSSGIENLNEAWEGSVTDQLVAENCPGTPIMAHTCRAQVDHYIANHKKGLPDTQLRPSNVTGNLSTLVEPGQRILHAMACGMVDIFTAYSWECWKKANTTLLPKLIADSQLKMIRDLYEQTGARDFLLVNLFPVNMTMDPAFSPAGSIATMTKFVDEANERLQKGADAFKKEKGDVRLEVVDWWKAIAKVYQESASADLEQYFGGKAPIVYGVCLKGDPNGQGIVEACKDPERYFWYDGHFSTSAQKYLSDFTLPYLEKLVAEGPKPTASASATPAATSAAASSLAAIASTTPATGTLVVASATQSTQTAVGMSTVKPSSGSSVRNSFSSLLVGYFTAFLFFIS